jgi:hypothetical protein
LVSLLSYIFFVLYYFTIYQYVSYLIPFTHWSMQPHLKSEFCFLLAFHLVKYCDCMCSIHISALYCFLVWVVVIVFFTMVFSRWFSFFLNFICAWMFMIVVCVVYKLCVSGSYLLCPSVVLFSFYWKCLWYFVCASILSVLCICSSACYILFYISPWMIYPL